MIDYRSAILNWAKSQIGPGNRVAYCMKALGFDPGKEKQWCGIFCLAALHENGIALDHKWGIDGSGMVGPLKLKPTRTPARGDIGIKEKNSAGKPIYHHWLFDYEHDGWYYAVAGNTPGVSEQRFRKDEVTVYAIEPLIPVQEAGIQRDSPFSVPGIQDPKT